MKTAEQIIAKIEKRVFSLNDTEKSDIKELINDYDEGDLTDIEKLAYEIADYLRTNENCIYDILKS